jgi:hypothetical protein
VAAQKIDLHVIRDIDLYRIEPWDLQGTLASRSSGQPVPIRPVHLNCWR